MPILTKEQIFNMTPESLPENSRYHKLEKFLGNRGTTIQGLAKQYKYPEESQYVLNFDWESLFKNCPKVFNFLCSPSRRQDTRNGAEFVIDLICGWLIEDRITKFFNERIKGMQFKMTGKDKERHIIINQKNDKYNNIDAVVLDEHKKEILQVEIQYSFSNEKYKIPLRWEKYSILRAAKAALLFVQLGTEAKDPQFILVDMTKEHRVEESENVFHKKGNELYLNKDEEFVPYNSNNLYKKLKDLIESRRK